MSIYHILKAWEVVQGKVFYNVCAHKGVCLCEIDGGCSLVSYMFGLTFWRFRSITSCIYAKSSHYKIMRRGSGIYKGFSSMCVHLWCLRHIDYGNQFSCFRMFFRPLIPAPVLEKMVVLLVFPMDDLGFLSFFVVGVYKWLIHCIMKRFCMIKIPLPPM